MSREELRVKLLENSTRVYDVPAGTVHLEFDMEVLVKLIDQYAINAGIDELRRINPATEWTLSAAARQATIGARILELEKERVKNE